MAYADGRAMPDRLTVGRHRQYLEYAARMLAAYRAGMGRGRRELHQAVHHILAHEPDCDRRRIAGFCKLLDDRCQYHKDPRGAAAKLRVRVFELAARHHARAAGAQGIPDHAGRQIKSRIAAELGWTWPAIESALYADVIGFQTLDRFDGYEGPRQLLSRYNVAQIQACLYRAQRMSITASRDFKTILRSARLCKLMHSIQRVDRGAYRIDLSGPASLVVETRRYGADFARFVPSLLACGGWEMRAELRTRWKGAAELLLRSEEGLSTHLAAPEPFDSSVEEAFAKDFAEHREGWRLSREDAILHDGQRTFVPDFVLRHADGRQVLLEIVGFWTPEYLEHKRRTLLRFRGHDILLAVAERNRAEIPAVGGRVIYYKKRIDPEVVLAVLRGTS